MLRFALNLRTNLNGVQGFENGVPGSWCEPVDITISRTQHRIVYFPQSSFFDSALINTEITEQSTLWICVEKKGLQTSVIIRGSVCMINALPGIPLEAQFCLMRSTVETTKSRKNKVSLLPAIRKPISPFADNNNNFEESFLDTQNSVHSQNLMLPNPNDELTKLALQLRVNINYASTSLLYSDETTQESKILGNIVHELDWYSSFVMIPCTNNVKSYSGAFLIQIPIKSGCFKYPGIIHNEESIFVWCIVKRNHSSDGQTPMWQTIEIWPTFQLCNQLKNPILLTKYFHDGSQGISSPNTVLHSNETLSMYINPVESVSLEIEIIDPSVVPSTTLSRTYDNSIKFKQIIPQNLRILMNLPAACEWCHMMLSQGSIQTDNQDAMWQANLENESSEVSCFDIRAVDIFEQTLDTKKVVIAECSRLFTNLPIAQCTLIWPMRLNNLTSFDLIMRGLWDQDNALVNNLSAANAINVQNEMCFSSCLHNVAEMSSSVVPWLPPIYWSQFSTGVLTQSKLCATRESCKALQIAFSQIPVRGDLLQIDLDSEVAWSDLVLFPDNNKEASLCSVVILTCENCSDGDHESVLSNWNFEFIVTFTRPMVESSISTHSHRLRPLLVNCLLDVVIRPRILLHNFAPIPITLVCEPYSNSRKQNLQSRKPNDQLLSGQENGGIRSEKVMLGSKKEYIALEARVNSKYSDSLDISCDWNLYSIMLPIWDDVNSTPQNDSLSSQGKRRSQKLWSSQRNEIKKVRIRVCYCPGESKQDHYLERGTKGFYRTSSQDLKSSNTEWLLSDPIEISLPLLSQVQEGALSSASVTFRRSSDKMLVILRYSVFVIEKTIHIALFKESQAPVLLDNQCKFDIFLCSSTRPSTAEIVPALHSIEYDWSIVGSIMGAGCGGAVSRATNSGVAVDQGLHSQSHFEGNIDSDESFVREIYVPNDSEEVKDRDGLFGSDQVEWQAEMWDNVRQSSTDNTSGAKDYMHIFENANRGCLRNFRLRSALSGWSESIWDSPGVYCVKLCDSSRSGNGPGDIYVWVAVTRRAGTTLITISDYNCINAEFYNVSGAQDPVLSNESQIQHSWSCRSNSQSSTNSISPHLYQQSRIHFSACLHSIHIGLYSDMLSTVGVESPVFSRVCQQLFLATVQELSLEVIQEQALCQPQRKDQHSAYIKGKTSIKATIDAIQVDNFLPACEFSVLLRVPLVEDASPASLDSRNDINRDTSNIKNQPHFISVSFIQVQTWPNSGVLPYLELLSLTIPPISIAFDDTMLYELLPWILEFEKALVELEHHRQYFECQQITALANDDTQERESKEQDCDQTNDCVQSNQVFLSPSATIPPMWTNVELMLYMQSNSPTNVAASEVGLKFVASFLQACAPCVYLGKVEVSSVELVLTLHASKPVYLALHKTPLHFAPLSLVAVFAYPQRLATELGANYVADALLRSPAVLGSLEMIGNPTALARDISTGVVDLFRMPLEHLKHSWSPILFVQGLGRGWNSMLRHVSRGFLTSVAGFASSAARNLDRLSLDENYVRTRQRERLIWKGNRGGMDLSLLERQGRDVNLEMGEHGLGQGLSHGLVQLGQGFWGAARDLVTKPVEGFAESGWGIHGLVKGVGKGLLGAVTKPASGFMEFVFHTSQGLMHTTNMVTFANTWRPPKLLMLRPAPSIWCLWKLPNVLPMNKKYCCDFLCQVSFLSPSASESNRISVDNESIFQAKDAIFVVCCGGFVILDNDGERDSLIAMAPLDAIQSIDRPFGFSRLVIQVVFRPDWIWGSLSYHLKGKWTQNIEPLSKVAILNCSVTTLIRHDVTLLENALLRLIGVE